MSTTTILILGTVLGLGSIIFGRVADHTEKNWMITLSIFLYVITFFFLIIASCYLLMTA